MRRNDSSSLGWGFGSSAVAGILFFFGIGIIADWEIPDQPPVPGYVGLLGILLLVAVWVLLVFGLKHRAFRIVAVLLPCVGGAAEMAIFGYRIEEVTLIRHVPHWPIWGGVTLIIFAALALAFGIVAHWVGDD